MAIRSQLTRSNMRRLFGTAYRFAGRSSSCSLPKGILTESDFRLQWLLYHLLPHHFCSCQLGDSRSFRAFPSVSSTNYGQAGLLERWGQKGKAASTAAAAETTSARPRFGVTLDIDGVLLKGHDPIPGAERALKRLSRLATQGVKAESLVPFVFLTNGGGVTERMKAAELTKTFGVEIREEQVVLGHTPFRDQLVERFHDKKVLVLGKHQPKLVMKEYGFKHIISVEELVEEYPDIDPMRSLSRSGGNGFGIGVGVGFGGISERGNNGCNAGGRMNVAQPLQSVLKKSGLRSFAIPTAHGDDNLQHISSVFVVSDPTNWGRDIQVVCDILQSGGLLPCGVPASAAVVDNGDDNDVVAHTELAAIPHQVPVYLAADDFIYQAKFPMPRLGMGAFRVALQTVYEQLSGKRFDYTSFGKPYAPAFRAAERSMLSQQLRHIRKLQQKNEQGKEEEEEKQRWPSFLQKGMQPYYPNLCLVEGEDVASLIPTTLYMIGDNPRTDIRGANQAGCHWFSILTRSGCHTHGHQGHWDVEPQPQIGDEKSQRHNDCHGNGGDGDGDGGYCHQLSLHHTDRHLDVANMVVDNVEEAIEFIFEREGVVID